MFKKLLRAAHDNVLKTSLLYKDVLVVAGVRTPCAHYDGLLDTELIGVVIDNVVKRATVPRTELKRLIMSTPSPAVDKIMMNIVAQKLRNCELHVPKTKGCLVNTFNMLFHSLQGDSKNECVMLADVQNYKTRFSEGEYTEMQGASELMVIPQTRQIQKPQLVETDSIKSAAAVVLTTEAAAVRLKLQPLARIRDVIIEKTSEKAVFRMLGRQGINETDVHSWKIVSREGESAVLMHLLRHFNFKKIRAYEINETTASHLLTQMAHSLPYGCLGCMLIESCDQQYMLLMLEKLVPEITKVKVLPQLTLYTKDNCPLCEELIEELDQHFAGSYELMKIYIDQKENVRFLRLFRHDIPVLFLNGQFLCMHKLNKSVLRERLSIIESSQK